jgi:hypothetical protein
MSYRFDFPIVIVMKICLEENNGISATGMWLGRTGYPIPFQCLWDYPIKSKRDALEMRLYGIDSFPVAMEMDTYINES